MSFVGSLDSVGSEDSIDSLDYSYLLEDLVEAPTLTSREMEHARKQALKILKTNSPEEAFKIFTKGSEVKADLATTQKANTPTMPTTTKGVDAKANTTLQPPPAPPKN